MKFMRILALLMAAALCLTACSAGNEEKKTEATPAPETAGADAPETYETFMIKNLNMPYESWMTESMYPAFAAVFLLDMAYADAFGVTEISNACGVPTAVYVGELQGDNYGNGMNLALFYTHPETADITMVNGTVYLKTGMFEGYAQEGIADAASVMDGFVTDGVLKVYHEVSPEEFMMAYASVNQAITEASSAAGAAE